MNASECPPALLEPDNADGLARTDIGARSKALGPVTGEESPCLFRTPPKTVKSAHPHTSHRARMAPQDREKPRSRPVLGVSACIVKAGRALLTKRARPPFLDKWSLPGGHVEGGESLEAAARREAAEETGVSCEIEELFHWVEIIGEEKHYVIAVFLARWTHGEPRPADDAKAVRWATAEEARQLETTPDLDHILAKALAR